MGGNTNAICAITAKDVSLPHFSGAFGLESKWNAIVNDYNSGVDIYATLSFEASRVVPTASDNHPYSIYLVPLITY